MLQCRRTWVSLVAIVALTLLGVRGQDVAFAIASVAAALSGANAWESRTPAKRKSKIGPATPALSSEDE